jgi:tetratricopeptide (TPR) repeat protein
MPKFAARAQQAILIISVALGTLAVNGAFASALSSFAGPADSAAASAFDPGVTGRPSAIDPAALANNPLMQSLIRGQWSSACAIATDILARKQADLDALGVFAMCAALRNDTRAAGTALLRLKEAEAAPYYYALLTEGILQLKNNSPENAFAAFRKVIRQRSADSLASYFSGEALHAQHRDAEAITAFKSSLEIWPDHAPALAAVARLISAGDVPRETLKSAVTMAERAAKIDPGNPAYWQQLSDLCERSGEHGRANAIKLQWLTRRSP